MQNNYFQQGFGISVTLWVVIAAASWIIGVSLKEAFTACLFSTGVVFFTVANIK